jgi:putative oxidoreductase
MFRRLIATYPTWAALPLRLALGIVFIAHGAQKVFGIWGGPGWAQFTARETPFAWMQPASFWMSAAALSELVGGVLVLLGLLTRLGALMIVPVMLVAVLGVHWSGGFFMARGEARDGIEYAFTLLMLSLALLVMGGGRASVDEALSGRRGRRR